MSGPDDAGALMVDDDDDDDAKKNDGLVFYPEDPVNTPLYQTVRFVPFDFGDGIWYFMVGDRSTIPYTRSEVIDIGKNAKIHVMNTDEILFEEKRIGVSPLISPRRRYHYNEYGRETIISGRLVAFGQYPKGMRKFAVILNTVHNNLDLENYLKTFRRQDLENFAPVEDYPFYVDIDNNKVYSSTEVKEKQKRRKGVILSEDVVSKLNTMRSDDTAFDYRRFAYDISKYYDSPRYIVYTDHQRRFRVTNIAEMVQIRDDSGIGMVQEGRNENDHTITKFILGQEVLPDGYDESVRKLIQGDSDDDMEYED